MRVEVDLDEDLAAFLTANVESGRFTTAADMLRAGANMLRGKCSEIDWEWAKLGRMVEEAEERGGPDISAEQFFAERRARRRKAA